jgi:hypothetical protein
MAELTTVEVTGILSFVNLQTKVQDEEGIFGVLVDLGTRGANNALWLSVGTAPAKWAVLEAYDGAAPPQKPNHTLICAGLCWVEGQPQKIAAYRPV